MSVNHLVKIGLMGVVGRFQAPDFQCYPRDARVICRTGRGLEVGVVLCPIDDQEQVPAQSEGQLLRPIGPEDELILQRLDKFRDKAFAACRKIIADRDIGAILVDVEHLFDGESVYFYFLGDADERVERLIGELGEAYDRKVRFKKFAETLANGCGPECGTQVGNCSAGGCSSCGLSAACGSQSTQAPESA